MSGSTGILYIVDDDAQARAALGRLLRAAGYQTRAFGSATEFLQMHAHLQQAPGCLILDLAMPDMSGLELQQALRRAGCRRPIVFLSGKADIPKSVSAMKRGAVNFLTKPVDAPELFAAVEEALAIDAAERTAWLARHGVVERLATLTPRERQVLGQLVAGKINKQIAAELGTAEKTVKVHRSRVMRKMHAGSIVELVKLASLVDELPSGGMACAAPTAAASPDFAPAQRH
jgi:FixJ family two-component response regulator